MAEYSSVEEARKQSGMRVVCAPGIPGPWGEAIKGVLTDDQRAEYDRLLEENAERRRRRNSKEDGTRK